MNQPLYQVNDEHSDLELIVLTQNKDGDPEARTLSVEDLTLVLNLMKRFREVAAERDAEIAFNGSSNIDPIKEVFDGKDRY